MSVNKVILVGNCCCDPEVRYMTNGEAVANVSVATNEKWKDKNGENQEKAEFHKLVFYRRLAEVVGEYVKKGGLLYVEGKLQTRKWQDKEGKDRYTTEIICHEMQMLGGKQSGEQQENESAARPSPSDKPAPKGNFDNFDDDIPFRESCLHYGLWRSM